MEPMIFKNKIATWELKDDTIFTYGLRKTTVSLCEISQIEKVKTSLKNHGEFHFFKAKANEKLNNLNYYTLFYKLEDEEQANIALEYIATHCGGKKAWEHRVRCNACGKLYCYTNTDIKENKSNSNMAALLALGSLANTIGGTQLGAYGQAGLSESYKKKIIDYSRCPYCNSVDISELTEEEYETTLQQENLQASKTQISAADEIMKFKGLLDAGIITQEEFDAKKKQLLGL